MLLSNVLTCRASSKKNVISFETELISTYQILTIIELCVGLKELHDESNQVDQLNRLIGISFDRFGNLYIVNHWNDNFVIVDINQNVLLRTL